METKCSHKISENTDESLMNHLEHRKCVSPRIAIFIGDPPFLN